MFLPMSWTSPLTVAISTLPRACVRVAAGGLLRFHERRQIGDRLLHHAGRLHHLRQEHLARAEQVADDAHAVHQRAFDDRQAATVLLPGFFGVLVDVLDDALEERVLEPLFDRLVAPRFVGLGGRRRPCPLTVSA